MKVDLEELKRKHEQRGDSAFAQRIWNDAIDSSFPAILAKLEAAEKLRNATSVYLEHMTEMNMLECGAALAAFDKETQNES